MHVSATQAWLMAARPKTLWAAAAPVLVGTGLAAAHGRAAAGPATAAMVGALLIQVGTNLANDYYDFMRGGDTEERLGPVRVTQAGILSPQSVKRGMILVFGLAMVVGVYLVAVGGWPIVIIGLASVAAGIAYTGGPYPLAYHGLGDVFVFVFFGLVAVAGTYWVQALEFRPELLWAGAAMGALNSAILVVNNLRDREADARTGKNTLAVKLGVRGSQYEYLVLMAFAYSVPLIGIVVFEWSEWALLALLSGVASMGPVRAVLSFEDPRELNPALGGTARVVALYGALLALGVGLG